MKSPVNPVFMGLFLNNFFFFSNTIVILHFGARKIIVTGGNTVGQLSEKELSSIKDLLSEEELLVKKFKMLAEHAQTPDLKNKMTEISGKHQKHFDELYAKLS